MGRSEFVAANNIADVVGGFYFVIYGGIITRESAVQPSPCYNHLMIALNFYTDLYEEVLKTGRKTATVRLGDKKEKYQTGQIVWVTTGPRYARRKKLFSAILDKVEVKSLSELSPRDIQRENPEFRTVDDVVNLLRKIYGEDLDANTIITIVYFSPIDEYEL